MDRELVPNGKVYNHKIAPSCVVDFDAKALVSQGVVWNLTDEKEGVIPMSEISTLFYPEDYDKEE